MRVNHKLDIICAQAEADRILVVAASDRMRRTLRIRSEAGEFIHVHGQCFARTEYWNQCTPLERYTHLIRTYARLHPPWVFCDMSAAAMWGINDSRRHMGVLHVFTTRQSHTHDYPMVKHHFAASKECTTVDGVRVSPLARTVFDCARRYDRPDALAVVESALRQGLISRKQLLQAFATQSGRYRTRALRALEHAEGRTENGGEAFSLGVMLDEGFAPPMLQLEIRSAHAGKKPDRVDGTLIVAELDGRVKYRDAAMYKDGSLASTIIAEKEREERIRLVADEVVRFSFSEAFDRRVLVLKLVKAGVPRVHG